MLTLCTDECTGKCTDKCSHSVPCALTENAALTNALKIAHTLYLVHTLKMQRTCFTSTTYYCCNTGIHAHTADAKHDYFVRRASKELYTVVIRHHRNHTADIHITLLRMQHTGTVA
jgi:hypothetical protein